MVTSGFGCCCIPCLGSWSCHSQGLYWCPWPILLSGAMLMPRVWATICDHVGIHPGQTTLSDQCCQIGPWFNPDQSCSQVLWPCHNQGPGWCIQLLRPSKTMPMLGVWATTWAQIDVRGPVASGAMLIRVAYNASWWSRPRNMSGSVIPPVGIIFCLTSQLPNDYTETSY